MQNLRAGLGVWSMSRGPPSRRALAEAIPVARQRGTVQMARPGPEKLYDLSIVSGIPLAFIRVSYCAQIFAPVAELAIEFRDELVRLRRIAGHQSISRELWLRSRYGRWRFFRLSDDYLVELGQDGKVITEKNAISR
jgi:hypothetical protein